MKKQSASVNFKDEAKKLPEPDGQNKKYKYKCATFIKKNCNDIIAWQIDS